MCGGVGTLLAVAVVGRRQTFFYLQLTCFLRVLLVGKSSVGRYMSYDLVGGYRTGSLYRQSIILMRQHRRNWTIKVDVRSRVGVAEAQ